MKDTDFTFNENEDHNDIAHMRGLEIAVRFPIDRDRDFWVVPHPTSTNPHHVVLADDLKACRCTCSDFMTAWQPCCHIHAARYARMRDGGRPLPSPEYPAFVPPGAPKWVTPKLIRETLQVWQVFYPTRLTVDDALAMLIAVSRLDSPE